MDTIAHIETDFPEKFGIPRQSGLVANLQGRIIFDPEYRNPDAFRGLSGFSHIWILWKFDGVKRHSWSATVKPPRLGGNKKMGVFATRSPFRPNDIGLSSVELVKVDFDEELGPVLYVAGADLMNGTRIYDIKPYLAYTDSHPDAVNGFAADVYDYELMVEFPQELLAMIPAEKQAAAIEILKQDPRPSYQDISDRRYGVSFAGVDIRFTVADGLLTVCEVVKL